MRAMMEARIARGAEAKWERELEQHAREAHRARHGNMTREERLAALRGASKAAPVIKTR